MEDNINDTVRSCDRDFSNCCITVGLAFLFFAIGLTSTSYVGHGWITTFSWAAALALLIWTAIIFTSPKEEREPIEIEEMTYDQRVDAAYLSAQALYRKYGLELVSATWNRLK